MNMRSIVTVIVICNLETSVTELSYKPTKNYTNKTSCTYPNQRQASSNNYLPQVQLYQLQHLIRSLLMSHYSMLSTSSRIDNFQAPKIPANLEKFCPIDIIYKIYSKDIYTNNKVFRAAVYIIKYRYETGVR